MLRMARTRLHRSDGRSISSGRAAPTRSSTFSARAPGQSSTPKSPRIFAASRVAHDHSRPPRTHARRYARSILRTAPTCGNSRRS